MNEGGVHAVTGAFGYSGKYIARRLIEKGEDVITLTNSLHKPNPFGERMKAFPFHFDQPEKLVESLRAVEVLYNTYWIRFNTKDFRHTQAIDNSHTLFDAAREAGVRRIVHVSITNPSEGSKLEYFGGKAELERAIIGSGLSYAILRPTVLFGKEDILINNIAWTLRRLPVFGVFGDGSYRLQPIYVDDLAKLAVRQGSLEENIVVNAIGPETFTFRGLVKAIGRIIGKQRPILSLPPRIAYWIGRSIGALAGDIMITWPEVKGLMAELLYVDTQPTGSTSLTTWAAKHAKELGRTYASELERRRSQADTAQSS
jgi:NADH dehydrogenase